MAYTPNLTLKNGGFTDFEGNPLASGYLLLQLSHDESYSVGPNQVVGGLKLQINLDANGNIPVSPATLVYSNDVLTPSGSVYYVRAFKADGTEAWASPQIWNLAASPNPLDVGTIAPLSPPGTGLSGGGSPILLETGGSPNSNQSLLNLVAGTGITLVNSAGTTTITNAGGGGGLGFSGNYHNLHQMTWNRGGVAAQISASYQINNGPAATNNDPSSTIPISVTWTLSVGTQQAIVYDTGGDSLYQWTLGVLKVSTINVRTDSNTSVRYWLGGMSGNVALYKTELDTDTPAISFVGFRFSTNAGDTAYQCVACTSGSQTTVSSGVAYDGTLNHTFQIVPSGAAVKYYIDGTLVGTISTNLPATTVGMNTVAYWDNLITSAAPTMTFVSIGYEST